ncbi:SDR family oxidoreductase [Propionibacteriaceae bacterium Y1685]
MSTLAVTGVTGGIGGRVARLLSAAGVEQRLLARDPDRVPDLTGTHPVGIGSYGNRELVRAALDGVHTLFMVSGAESADRLDQHRRFIAMAAEVGVQHIVYTSFLGASPDATFTLVRDHHATEQMIMDAGIGHTFLRDSLYADFLPLMAGEDRVLRGPAGDGRVSVVARDDVARTAAVVLQNPAVHLGATYDLTGPEALTFTEIAAILTEVTGQTHRFHNETIDEAYASRRRWQAADWQYDAWVSTYTAIAAGELETVSDAIEQVTGTPPLSLRELLSSGR